MSLSCLKAKKFGIWHKFFCYTLRWEAEIQDCTVDWVERRFQIMNDRDGGPNVGVSLLFDLLQSGYLVDTKLTELEIGLILTRTHFTSIR